MSRYVNIPPGVGVGQDGVWAQSQKNLIDGVVSGLTYQYIKAGQVPMGGAIVSTNDGAIEGGGRSGANATITAISASVFQTARTAKCAFAFRVKFLAAAAGQENYVGIINAAGTHNQAVGVINSISATNYVLVSAGTATTTNDLGVANDLGLHTFVVILDTANIRVFLDGTLAATRAIGTNVDDEPLYLASYNTLAGETVWTECLYGYVAP